MITLATTTTFQEGQRVAVKYGRDKYFIGTIKKVGQSKCRVVEDDEGDADLWPIKDILRVADGTKRMPDHYSLAEVQKILHRAPPSKDAPHVKPIFNPGLHVNDRVAADFDHHGEWFVGTIHQITGDKYYVLYDDGDDRIHKVEDLIKLPRDTPRYRQELTREQVDKIAKEGLGIQRKQLTDAAEEAKAAARVGNPKLFLSALDSKQDMVRYINHVWHKANAEFFQNKLVPPHFKIGKDAGAKLKNLGMWYPMQRVLLIRPRCFNNVEGHAVGIILHEMCHQAAHEIHFAAEPKQGGHGPVWQAMMRKCGLTPSRYAGSDWMENTFSTEELERNQRKMGGAKQLQEPIAPLTNFQRVDKKGRVVKGVVVAMAADRKSYFIYDEGMFADYSERYHRWKDRNGVIKQSRTTYFDDDFLPIKRQTKPPKLSWIKVSPTMLHESPQPPNEGTLERAKYILNFYKTGRLDGAIL